MKKLSILFGLSLAKWDNENVFVHESRKRVGHTIFDASKKSTVLESAKNVQYTLLEDGKPATTFKIDSNGLVSLAKPLDRETKDVYKMTISAEDSNGNILEKKKSFNLIVSDGNDNRPTFDKSFYNFEIKEHAKAGTQLTPISNVDEIVVEDADLRTDRKGLEECEVGYNFGDFEFKIDSEYFQVKTCFNEKKERYEPLITLKAAFDEKLDRENQPIDDTLDFFLWAEDMGVPAQKSERVKIQVKLADINDFAPKFDMAEYSGSVREDVQIGAEVMRVDIVDPDTGSNADVVVRLVNDETASFSVQVSDDQSQAIIKTTKQLDAERDFPPNQVHKFELTAYSKEKLQNAENTIAKAQVQVKVINVDEPPVVSERRLFVEENLPPGTAIANSSGLASDPEGDSFSYSIGNSEEVPFDIDSQSGQITTNRRLDFEAKESYKIEVLATPSVGPAGSGIVEINIIDKNDMKPRPSGSMTITYCVNNPSWSSNINFTDPDYQASPKIEIRQNTRSSAWNGIELVMIESGAGWATVSIRTNDESRIAAGMKLPVIVSDNKYEEEYDLIINTCYCNDRESMSSTCDAIIGSPPMKAQLAVAVIVAVGFSLVTIIIFTAWRKRRVQKQFNCELPPMDNFDDDIRENIVQYAEEAGEEPGPADYNLQLLQKETMQRNSKQNGVVPKEYTDSLKKKVANVSNQYNIAPYDSLQLYHYEGANSIFSSLSSIHSALTERSLNFAAMDAQPKMEKIMKLFESSDPFSDSRNLESISLNATLTRMPKKNLQVTCLEEADTGIDLDFRTDL